MGKLVSLSRHRRQRETPLTVPLEARDDDTLMRLAQGGVERAFDVLVRRHQQQVIAISVKYLQDIALAQDMAQTSFLDLYRNRDKYRPKGKFRAFLARIVINNCKMALRHARTEADTRRVFQSAGPSHTEMNENELFRKEQQQLMEIALSRLSPKLRDVLTLRFAAEMSYREIADTLGIRVGTVKSRIFAGIEKLSQTMEEMER